MNASPQNALGLKVLTGTNWLETDPAWEGVIISLSGPDASTGWVNDLMRVQLDQTIPVAIRKIFEVARGTLVYSLMFYPLLTLGAEQLFRVLEAAVSLRCEALAAPPKLKTFNNKIEWLAKQRHIPPEQLSRWHAMRKLRNLSSHPTDQSIFSVGMTITILDTVSELVSALFL
jgi:Domain of unknown function (DUF4145)